METTKRVAGLCQTMCPIEEFEMREREGLLHQLEIPLRKGQIGQEHIRGRGRGRGKHRPVGDLECAVKEYTRPAAGRADPDPRVLRPAKVLHKTINFLFNTHIGRQHSHRDWKDVYEFVFDRLRAVRQDMVIQELSGQDAVTILEACVSFHVYAAYRLCEEGLETFDPVINHHHTQECLKRLLYLYSQTDTDTNIGQRSHTQICSQAEGINRHRCSHGLEDTDSNYERIEGQIDDAETGARQKTQRDSSRETTGNSSCSTVHAGAESIQSQHELEAQMKGLSVSYSSGTPRTQASGDQDCEYPNRAVFESVYLLYNLGDSHALSHFLQLPRSIRCQQLPALVYEMSVSFMLGNTLRVLREAASLQSPLALCAFHQHLASVQSYGLQVLCVGFSSKATRFPLHKLGQLLGHDSESQTIAACIESGLQVHDGMVSLLKSSFQRPKQVRCRAWEYLEGRLSDVDIPNMLLGLR